MMRGGGCVLLVGLALLGACEREAGPEERHAENGASPDAAGEATPAAAQPESEAERPDYDTDSGRWRKARPRQELSAEQRAEIQRLEAIGYLSGTELAGEQVGITVHQPERCQDGLNLVVSGHAAQAELMTLDGRVLHSWSLPYEEAFPERTVREGAGRKRRGGVGSSRHMWRRVRLLPGGELLAIYEFRGLVKVDVRSRRLWSWDDQAHHDLDLGPEGEIHVLSRRADLLPDFHPEQPVLDDFLVVLSPEGEERRRVSVLACLQNSDFAAHLDAVRGEGGDILHTNTLQVLDGRDADRLPEFAAGNLLISSRSLSLLAVVDPRAEKVVWAMTGPWERQHEPVMLPGGKLLLFDNGSVDARRSSVLRIDPRTGEVEWRYQEAQPDAFYSRACGVVQPLANGNVLVTESVYGRAFELDPDRRIVWEFRSPYRAGDEGELVATLFDVVRIDPGSVEDWLPR